VGIFWLTVSINFDRWKRLEEWWQLRLCYSFLSLQRLGLRKSARRKAGFDHVVLRMLA